MAMTSRSFDYLAEHGLGHVFLQGYYMPPIFGVYLQFREKLADPVVIRLHGPDRKVIEERTGEIWDKMVEPRAKELEEVARMVGDLKDRQRCAPQGG